MTVISSAVECCGRAAIVWSVTPFEAFGWRSAFRLLPWVSAHAREKEVLNSKHVTLPAYLVAVSMIFIPLADTWTTLFPWNVGDARWRFGAVGLISNALMIPLAGLLVAFTVAWVREQRAVMRGVALIGFFGATLCLLALVSFALDALQTRAQVRAEMRLSFNVASITAAIKTLLAGATFAAFGLSGWRASRTRATKSNGAAGGLFTLPTAPSTMKSGEPV
jgi:hypothetical protein